MLHELLLLLLRKHELLLLRRLHLHLHEWLHHTAHVALRHHHHWPTGTHHHWRIHSHRLTAATATALLHHHHWTGIAHHWSIRSHWASKERGISAAAAAAALHLLHARRMRRRSAVIPLLHLLVAVALTVAIAALKIAIGPPTATAAAKTAAHVITRVEHANLGLHGALLAHLLLAHAVGAPRVFVKAKVEVLGNVHARLAPRLVLELLWIDFDHGGQSELRL